jgi:hypothetical protein
VAASRSRFPPLDPLREARVRTDHALPTGALIATFRCAAPARRGAFADERPSWWATEAAACGRETLIRSARAVRSDTALFGGPVAADTSRFPPIGPVREAGAGDSLLTSGLIATFHRAAPARCGAVADARRIAVATEAAEYGRETLIHPVPRRQCRGAAVWSVGGLHGGPRLNVSMPMMPATARVVPHH